MPELDPFDVRLEHAVHAFADRAQTSVDAVAVAGQAIGRRRSGPWAVLGRAVPVPVALLVVPLVLVGLLGWSLAGGGPFPVRVWLGPVATPTAAPTTSPAPTAEPSAATPIPSTDGAGDEAVAGTEVVALSTPPAVTVVGGVTRQRDGMITTRASMNDFRVDGNGTWQFSADLRSGAGPAWGAYRLENTGGAWEGTCTGSLWADGAGGARSCWLAGTGDYDGFTYYLSATWSDTGGDVRGVIYPGSPPAP